jgi:hypothetical protein
MKIILRKTLVSLLGLISFLASIQISYAQNEKCNPVPVKEAVRNGDFEKGYVNGTGKTYLS